MTAAYRSNCLARNRGFSLIELMLVVAIIGICSTLAISGLSNSFRTAQNYEASWQGMRNLVARARAQALSRGQQVAVVVSGTSLIAFVDVNGNCAYDANEPLIATFPNTAAGQPTLTATQTMKLPSGCTGNAGAQYMAFTGGGYPTTSSGSFVSSLVFSLSDTANKRTKTCTVYVSGYIGCTG